MLALVLVGGGLVVWHWQTQILGTAARWYLTRMARSEEASGGLAGRRQAVARLHRTLLMSAPADALVPELFDVMTALSSRVASGEISLDWAAYLYTSYERDLVRDRPTGTPRRSSDEVAAELQRDVEFFSIRKRPDAPGLTVGELMGTGDDVITLEEIEEAERTGKKIDLRTRGARQGGAVRDGHDGSR